MTELVRYNQACQALAEAKSVDEVKDIHDRAAALRAYAQQAQNRQLEVDAAEIRIRAERRLGEMLTEAKNAGQVHSGRPEKNGPYEEPFPRVTLEQAGIDKKLSARAQKLAAVPEQQFGAMLSEWRERVADETERVTTNLLREGERNMRDAELKEPPPAEGLYGLIYADPPWRYEHSRTKSREIENQYPTMSLEEIKALSVPAAEDCILFLWTTSPKLAESLEVVAAWGFTYRTCAVWDKEVIGMGYYFRQQHELLLVATRGSPGTPVEAERVSSVIRAKRSRHSEKPAEVYEILESMYPNAARIELFQRAPRDGWKGWGNQLAAA